jgi:hypothetical protein
MTDADCHRIVMAGLVPAIHVFLRRNEDVDARHKAGHDERNETLAKYHAE